MSLELFGHPFSSYTWKALIALYANETPFEFHSLNPGDEEQGKFLNLAHPAGKFPVLVDGDRMVIEATSIIEHLAVHHPGPAPLIPRDADEAITARMLDRVFDNYVMTNMNRVVVAHFIDRDNPLAGPRETPDSLEVEAGQRGLRRAYAWLEQWLTDNKLPPHVSIVTCAAAPSLFYADWVERIPDDCPNVAALRAELLALPSVSRCVEDARYFRPYFPPGAPDRD